MRIAIVGCGSIGLRHTRNLHRLGGHDIVVYDPAPAAREAAAAEGASIRSSLAALLADGPEAVLVCTPPNDHVATARAAVRAGAHVFVEKPIAPTVDGVRELLAAAQEAGRYVVVGYNLRFDAALAEMKRLLDSGAIGRLIALRAEFGQYLPDWRPLRDYRANFSASAEEGGGIVLEASHEIDYVRWLAGEPRSVYAVAERLGDLEVAAEDVAAITMRMSSDAIAEIHVDFLQRAYSRCCKAIGTEGTLVWQLDQSLQMYTAASSVWRQGPVSNRNATYIAELRHFLDCVSGRLDPLVSGDDGLRVLEIALAVKRSAAERRELLI